MGADSSCLMQLVFVGQLHTFHSYRRLAARAIAAGCFRRLLRAPPLGFEPARWPRCRTEKRGTTPVALRARIILRRPAEPSICLNTSVAASPGGTKGCLSVYACGSVGRPREA